MIEDHAASGEGWRPHREWLMVAGVFVGALIWPAVTWQDHPFAVGKSVVGAERVLAGDVIYRDFWTMYAPGHFYVLAGLFSVWGVHLKVSVIAASVTCAATAGLCYRMARRVGAGWKAGLFVAGVFIAALYTTAYWRRFGSYPPAIFLVVLALNFGAAYWDGGRRRSLVLCGLSVGVLVLFKHDVGVYTAIALGGGLIGFHLVGRRAGAPGGLARSMVAFGAGIAVPVLPAAMVVAAAAGSEAWWDLVVFPLTDFPFSRPEAYPEPWELRFDGDSRGALVLSMARYLMFTIPFVVFVLGMIVMVMAAARRNAMLMAICLTTLIGLAMHYRAAHVQINTHIVTMSLYAAILSVVGYRALVGDTRSGRTMVVRIIAALVCAGWLMVLAAPIGWAVWIAREQSRVVVQLPKASGFWASAGGAAQAESLRHWIDVHTEVGEPIYVGVHRHDMVITGEPMLYFLLDRPSATRYHELHPAITDTAPIQREIIDELERGEIRVVILVKAFGDEVLDRTKRELRHDLPQIGATELDEYIAAHYEAAEQIGRHTILLRRSAH